MSFAIEVPGDANPFSLPELCRVLQSATAANFAERQSAGQQLQTWETQQGYYSGLQSVFLDKTLPMEIRFLAVIQLKNGIDKYWRLYSHIKNGLQPEEKALIRSRLFQGTLEEEENGLALQNSLATAKVIRIEYPQQWPDALSSLIGLLRTSRAGNQQHLYGGLQILLRVVKELGTARMRSSQTALQSATPEVVFLLGEIYSEKTAQWVEFLGTGRGDEDDAYGAMLNSLAAIKTLRRLLISGYESPHHDKTVQEFWSLSQNHFGQLLGFVSHDSAVPAPLQAVIGKHLLQFTKMHLAMADSHPESFVMLPNSLPLVHAYWDLVAKFAEVFDKSGGIRAGPPGESGQAQPSKFEGPLLERLALKGLLLMRSCRRIASAPMQTFRYRSPKAKEEQDQAVRIVKTELFKGDFVIQVVNIIITHLFVFRKADLDAWDEDPEEWEQREQNEGNAYEWEVKPCAEKLFLDMITDHKALLVPPLLSYFQSAANPQADIATKEAVYTALGIAAAHVVDVFDFDSLVASTLVGDAQQRGPLYKVLRRRIAILISQWATIKMSDQSKALAYEMFRHFMDPKDPNNDIVVRLTAARQLKWILDDLEFRADAFLPHTSAILEELVDLVQNVDVDETTLAIMETIRLLVTRMEDHIDQFGDFIMKALPAAWDNTATDEYMIKQSVIAILGALVMSMGEKHQRYQPFMVPLIAEAMRPDSDLHGNLMDESLELWNNILIQSSPPLSPDLLNLVPLALPLLEYQVVTAEQALQAVNSYILLAPEAVTQDSLRRPLIQALSQVLESQSQIMVSQGTICLEYLITVARDLGGPEGMSVVLKDLADTGFLAKILGGIRDAWEAKQTTGPNRKLPRLTPLLEKHYFTILARLCLGEPGLFVDMLGSFGPLEQVWGWLSSEWFTAVDDSDDIDSEKLSLLALTRLLELPQPMQALALGRLQDYVALWTKVILELQDGIADGDDCLVVQAAAQEEEERQDYDTPRSVREREFHRKDAIHVVNALAFVRERLEDMVARVGGEARFDAEWAVNVDKDILQRFWELIRSRGGGHGASA